MARTWFSIKTKFLLKIYLLFCYLLFYVQCLVIVSFCYCQICGQDQSKSLKLLNKLKVIKLV